MMKFWTLERRVQLERHLKAGKSAGEIAREMGLTRKQVTNNQPSDAD
jgi:DNA-binding CsgD family transcriptional regulator